MNLYALNNAIGVLPRWLRQTLLVMRITTLIILISLMQVSAASFAQKLTFSKQNITLKEIFSEIRKQTGYFVLYSNDNVNANKKLDVNFKNTDLKDVLEKCISGQALEYSIDNNNIIIKEKLSLLDKLSPILNSFQDINVHGRVTDAEGKALPGASVKIKSSGKSVSTDANGGFELKGVDEGAVLVISFIGYVSKEIKATHEIGDVVLELSDSKLDEVQVIAYGTTSQRLSTGNVSTVKAEDIEKQPINNPLLALAGRVPGLMISQASGFSGSGVQVNIQGQNSIRNGNNPFYVIDGVPYTSQLLPNLGNILGASQSGGIVAANSTYGNPLSFINPQDIESVEILKDADATAIYGSKAANGVILITTKKGRAGQTKVDANIQSGFGNVTGKLKLLNTKEYLEMRKEAYKNDNVTIPALPTLSAYDLTFWDQNRYTDWQKELIGNTSHYNDAQLTISGGNVNTQYLVGGGYHKETTVFPASLSDTKASLHFNINNVSNNQKFRLTLSGSYLLDNNKLPNVDLTETALRLAPNMPALRTADGSLNWERTPEGRSTIDNPLARLTALYKNKTSNLISNANLSYQILPGLDVKSSLGYTVLQTDELTTSPSTIFAPEYAATFNRTAQYGNNNINSWIIEPQITFNRVIGRGRIETLLGTSIQQTNNSRKWLMGSGYSSDNVLESINAATSVTVPFNSTILSVYKYNALFGRINYVLDEKYIINLTARRDGTSRFGSENRFHNFGAIGAAWLFSNEKIIKEKFSFLSFGKARFSYGTTGNDQIDDYQYLALYDYNIPAVPYSGGGGLVPTKLSNPYLQWEEVKKMSIGLDLGFLHDRLLLNITYYQNRTSNQLLDYNLPPSVGFYNVLANLPATIQNSGLELTLSTVNLKTKTFNWSTNFNLTVPKNKLIRFDNLESSSYASQFSIGQPITIQRGYKFIDVNSTTGSYEFLQKDGNITSNPTNNADNRTELINVAPKLFGGLQNSLTYKGFSLDILFQFVKQVAKTNYYGSIPGFSAANQPITVLNRWKAPGDNAPIQRFFRTNFDYFNSWNAASLSSASYDDASYIRLKNLSLSWQVPGVWIDKVKIKNARLYLQGQNLLTITKYQGLDPESRSSTSLPPLRVLIFGAQITF